MVNYRVATAKDEKKIYNLWHKVGKYSARVFGLTESIERGEVFVFTNGNDDIGFIRFLTNKNKTMNYIKIAELYIKHDYIDSEASLEKIVEIRKIINSLILKNGYLLAEVTVLSEDHEFFDLIADFQGVKVTTSGDSAYNNFCYRISAEYDKELFGEFLMKQLGVEL